LEEFAGIRNQNGVLDLMIWWGKEELKGQDFSSNTGRKEEKHGKLLGREGTVLL